MTYSMVDDAEAFKTDLVSSDAASVVSPRIDHAATPYEERTLKVKILAATPTVVPQPPPSGGLTAWVQVLGAHFLFFNAW